MVSERSGSDLASLIAWDVHCASYRPDIHTTWYVLRQAEQ